MKDPIPALIKNAEAFADKGRQLSPSVMSALGVELHSRYGKISEMIDMLRFVELAASRSVAHYVKGVSFDSKHGSCSFTLAEQVLPGTDIKREIFATANECFAHFHWLGEEHWNIPDEDL